MDSRAAALDDVRAVGDNALDGRCGYAHDGLLDWMIYHGDHGRGLAWPGWPPSLFVMAGCSMTSLGDLRRGIGLRGCLGRIRRLAGPREPAEEPPDGLVAGEDGA